MPIYMDIHIIPGVKAKDVAEAHRLDVLMQDEHDCKCMTYWIDEERENVFCLIEAPDKEAVEQMHSHAHGLIPHRIIEVNSNIVESFLGRIYDPEEAEVTKDGLKVFADPSFRVLLVTRATDPILLQHAIGKEAAAALLNEHCAIVRKNLATYHGREVEHEGTNFIASFASAAKAVSCAIAIQKDHMHFDHTQFTFKIGINAGEPINKSEKLFGDTIQLAGHMCLLAGDHQVAVSSQVKDLVSKEYFQDDKNIRALSQQDETLLESLFDTLEKNWHEPDFNVTDYCHAIAMSKSQLYRKTIELTGHSPNSLLKEFRLAKAKEMMNKKRYSIAQITFDAGFTSPSYFTKCFKKKYGLLPMAYLDLLH
ncbi:MAG: DUF4242 domain-containing protein [Chitinophagaceae bacterium]|nr:DUF4242 domain-containing protein [Chitinophagaceae bacterium]